MLQGPKINAGMLGWWMIQSCSLVFQLNDAEISGHTCNVIQHIPRHPGPLEWIKIAQCDPAHSKAPRFLGMGSMWLVFF